MICKLRKLVMSSHCTVWCQLWWCLLCRLILKINKMIIQLWRPKSQQWHHADVKVLNDLFLEVMYCYPKICLMNSSSFLGWLESKTAKLSSIPTRNSEEFSSKKPCWDVDVDDDDAKGRQWLVDLLNLKVFNSVSAPLDCYLWTAGRFKGAFRDFTAPFVGHMMLT